MQAVQIYEINALGYLEKHILEVQTYEDFKKLKTQLLCLNQHFKKRIIMKMTQSLENNFNLMQIVDSEQFQVKIEKLKKQRKFQFKLIFSKK